ncbi:MAG: hypothetical protein HY784_13635, partial [Chloroflexi bacterium]|nr:hypothetical protein [Chloroflexota bacterium]
VIIQDPDSAGCYSSTLPGWAIASDPDDGTSAGAGIASVRFTITGPGGQGTVHDHTEFGAAYCAFGGNQAGCAGSEENLADGTWSDTGKPVLNGVHTMTVIATDNEGAQTTATVTFTVCIPATATPTRTPTRTVTPSPTNTTIATPTPTRTPTRTPTIAPTQTPSPTVCFDC